jgi:hypothetical protein
MTSWAGRLQVQGTGYLVTPEVISLSSHNRLFTQFGSPKQQGNRQSVLQAWKISLRSAQKLVIRDLVDSLRDQDGNQDFSCGYSPSKHLPKSLGKARNTAVVNY